MANRKWREQTIAELAKRGVTYEDSCKLLRYSATLHRLAEAQCNGDWPYNGDRDAPEKGSVARERWDRRYVVCPECQASGVARSSMKHRSAGERRKYSRASSALEALEHVPFGDQSAAMACAMRDQEASAPVCPDCWTSAKVREMVKGWQAGHTAKYPALIGVHLQGDPRGCVLALEWMEWGGTCQTGIAG